MTARKPRRWKEPSVLVSEVKVGPNRWKPNSIVAGFKVGETWTERAPANYGGGVEHWRVAEYIRRAPTTKRSKP